MNNKVHVLSEGAEVTELWGRVTPACFNDYEVHVNRIEGELRLARSRGYRRRRRTRA